jgi:hypothetical protein
MSNNYGGISNFLESETGVLEDVLELVINKMNTSNKCMIKNIIVISQVNRALRNTVWKMRKKAFKNSCYSKKMTGALQPINFNCYGIETTMTKFWEYTSRIAPEYRHMMMVRLCLSRDLRTICRQPRGGITPVLRHMIKAGLVTDICIHMGKVIGAGYDSKPGSNWRIPLKLVGDFTGLPLLECTNVDVSRATNIDVVNYTHRHNDKDIGDVGHQKKVVVNHRVMQTDTTAFANVECLHMHGRHASVQTLHEQIRGLPRRYVWLGSPVSDVSTLGNLKELLIVSDKLTDVSALCHIPRLHIETPHLLDVSMLGDVDTLVLRNCTGVSDVSALGRVRQLNLHSCTSVTDVSMLSGVYRLNLARCLRLIDMSMLGSVAVKEDWTYRISGDRTVDMWCTWYDEKLHTTLASKGYSVNTDVGKLLLPNNYVNDTSTPFDDIWNYSATSDS